MSKTKEEKYDLAITATRAQIEELTNRLCWEGGIDLSHEVSQVLGFDCQAVLDISALTRTLKKRAAIAEEAAKGQTRA